jgi:hypothetical protein
MGVKQDLDAAVTTLIAAQRTNLAAAELIMTTVATNTITAQQVIDMNAAIAAIRASIVAANPALRAAAA